jgi:hypothetical protein
LLDGEEMIELEKAAPLSPLRGRGKRKGEEGAGLLGQEEEPASPPQHFTVCIEGSEI